MTLEVPIWLFVVLSVWAVASAVVLVFVISSAWHWKQEYEDADRKRTGALAGKSEAEYAHGECSENLATEKMNSEKIQAELDQLKKSLCFMSGHICPVDEED